MLVAVFSCSFQIVSFFEVTERHELSSGISTRESMKIQVNFQYFLYAETIRNSQETGKIHDRNCLQNRIGI